MLYGRNLKIACIVFGCCAVKSSALLPVGTEAPEFCLASHTGDSVRLSTYRGKNSVVLIFYPGDETPRCTQQLCEIRDEYSVFAERGAVVLAINPASAESHRSFAQKHAYPFPLLIDTNSVVARVYMAKGLIMNKRTVYIVGKDGRITFAERGKPPVEKLLKHLGP